MLTRRLMVTKENVGDRNLPPSDFVVLRRVFADLTRLVSTESADPVPHERRSENRGDHHANDDESTAARCGDRGADGRSGRAVHGVGQTGASRDDDREHPCSWPRTSSDAAS
jgi:hypothetical protein